MLVIEAQGVITPRLRSAGRAGTPPGAFGLAGMPGHEIQPLPVTVVQARRGQQVKMLIDVGL
ncbi:hypothetical protein V5O39_31045 [Pseudomonas parakoreensis]